MAWNGKQLQRRLTAGICFVLALLVWMAFGSALDNSFVMTMRFMSAKIPMCIGA